MKVIRVKKPKVIPDWAVRGPSARSIRSVAVTPWKPPPEAKWERPIHRPAPAARILELPQVTIWTCCYTAEPDRIERHLRVLAYCQSIIKCGRILFFSPVPVQPKAGIDTLRIEPGSDFNWNTFVNYEVPKHINTPFAMSVHEDGFPIRPDLWQPEFLNYDYIGAPWADGSVGNGGFNIESQKLLQEKLQFPFSKDDERHNSDQWVCHHRRTHFESHGVTFAPKELALKFSTETNGNEYPSFGFHGRSHAIAKYRMGWEIIEMSELNSRSMPRRMTGKICITTTFDRNYKLAGTTLFRSIKHHTDCEDVDFKIITADPQVVKEFGEENCHVVTDAVKARYANVAYSKELPAERYSSSWYRFELFSLEGYDRVICIDSDCLCVRDIGYLFSEELNPYDLISVEDHIVSKCFTYYVPELEAQGLNFRSLKKRMHENKVDIQPALIVANKSIVNKAWYDRLIHYANTTGFTYSIDEGILNDFVYQDNLKIKLLPLEFDYQDLYEFHCKTLPVPAKPVIVHCQESKPFKKARENIPPYLHKWHDQWWAEFKHQKTIVVIIVWNRFENLQRWLNCWNRCEQADAELVVIHNQEKDNERYKRLCQQHGVKYVPRANVGFDIGAFQDVCKERLAGFPNKWDNLIWITDDCIPMQRNFVQMYLTTLLNGGIPCYEISDEFKRHVRTTGFLVTKDISKRLTFPHDPITDREDCYRFEHKGFNLYEQIQQMGLKSQMMVPALHNAPLWDMGCRSSLQLMPKHQRIFPPLMESRIPKPTPPTPNSMDELAIKYKADKSSLYHNFAAKYDKLLSPLRDSLSSMLEIGVAQGQSMRMWADYFTNATIHGADISEPSKICEAYSNRIKFHLLDQGNPVQLKNLEPFSPFDLIVDDGNHFWREQIVSFETLFPFLKNGGIYIVEDTCTSYWPEYGNHPINCMDYFKGLVDEVNFRGAKTRPPLNPSPDFSDWHKGWHRREDCFDRLPAIESIHFLNAIIVIHKRPL